MYRLDYVKEYKSGPWSGKRVSGWMHFESLASLQSYVKFIESMGSNPIPEFIGTKPGSFIMIDYDIASEVSCA